MHVFELDMGTYIRKDMGTLLRSCAEVRAANELSFGMVSGVGPGIDVRNGSRGRVDNAQLAHAADECILCREG